MKSPVPYVLSLSMLPLAFAMACGDGLQAVYPPRPALSTGTLSVDPPVSRVVIHASVSAAGLKKALEDQIPSTGSGSFSLLGSQRTYSWRRVSLAVSLMQGRLVVQTQVMASVSLPLSDVKLPIDLKLSAEPVISSDYRARLQSATAEVSSTDARLKVLQGLAGALDTIKEQLETQVRDFSYDLRPVLGEAYERISKPIDLPLGDAHGCAYLKILGLEAAPTVLADGIEKDIAMIIAPSVTLPCSAPVVAPPIPPLSNVASLPTGPFTITVPIAARYEELQKAMSLAFTDGKLFFSKEYPKLYLEKPEVYQHKDQLVLKVHITGPVQKGSLKVNLDGDLFMIGKPQVVDNELRVPDLEPTIETSNFLLKLVAALNGSEIRDAARNALRLDIGERLKAVREKLSSEISFGDANAKGCFRGEVSRIEVNGVYPHGGYLRVYVQATGIAAVYMPCPAAITPLPPAGSAPNAQR